MPLLQAFAKDLMDAILDAIRNAFNFSGRTNRKGFWLFLPVFLLFHGAAQFGLTCFPTTILSETYRRFIIPLSFLPLFSLTVRRLHDLSAPGLLLCIPLWLLLLPSQFSSDNLKYFQWLFTYAIFFDYPEQLLLLPLILYYGVLAVNLCYPSKNKNCYGVKPVGVLTCFEQQHAVGIQWIHLLILLVCHAACLWAARYEWTDYRSLNAIVDYRPTHFQEATPTPFFYTIDDQLKHGRFIDPNAPTLISAKPLLPWGNLAIDARSSDRLRVYPAPNHRKAAILIGGILYLVEPGKTNRRLLDNVDTPFKKLFPAKSSNPQSA